MELPISHMHQIVGLLTPTGVFIKGEAEVKRCKFERQRRGHVEDSSGQFWLAGSNLRALGFGTVMKWRDYSNQNPGKLFCGY